MTRELQHLFEQLDELSAKPRLGREADLTKACFQLLTVMQVIDDSLVIFDCLNRRELIPCIS